MHYLPCELRFGHSASQGERKVQPNIFIGTPTGVVFEKSPAPRAEAINLMKVKKGSHSTCTLLTVKLSVMTCVGLIFGRWKKKRDPLILVLMSPLTVCESIYENTTGLKCSYTPALKLMDQLKGFVGMAIFLSQMATSPGITSVSNSALWYQHAVSPQWKWTHTLFILTVKGEAHGGQEGSHDRTCYLVHIIHPTLFLQFGTCCKYAVQGDFIACATAWIDDTKYSSSKYSSIRVIIFVYVCVFIASSTLV